MNRIERIERKEKSMKDLRLHPASIRVNSRSLAVSYLKNPRLALTKYPAYVSLLLFQKPLGLRCVMVFG